MMNEHREGVLFDTTRAIIEEHCDGQNKVSMPAENEVDLVVARCCSNSGGDIGIQGTKKLELHVIGVSHGCDGVQVCILG